MVLGVVRRIVLGMEAGYRIRAGVRDVHPCGPEAYPGHGCREHHRPPGLDVLAVLHGPPEVLPAVLQSLTRPQVRDRVRPLVWRALVRGFGLLTLIVGLAGV